MTMSDSMMALIVTQSMLPDTFISQALAFDAQFIEYRFLEFAVGLVRSSMRATPVA